MIRAAIITAYTDMPNQIPLMVQFLESLQEKISNLDKVVIVNAGGISCGAEAVTLEKNIGFANSMNAGIKYAQETYDPDYYIIMGNDTFPVEQDWIEKLIECQEDTGAALVVPVPSRPVLSTYNHFLMMDGSPYAQYKMFPAICWLLPKQTIEKVGVFDERFLLGCYEDNDYCHRIGLAGGILILTKWVHVNHLLSQTFGNHPDAAKAMETNLRLYKEKWSI